MTWADIAIYAAFYIGLVVVITVMLFKNVDN